MEMEIVGKTGGKSWRCCLSCETVYAKEVMTADFTEVPSEISERDQDVTVTARVISCEGVVVVCVG